MGARPLKKLKTVLVSGNFNILHPGHLRLLKFAKECGDRLTVVVMSDSLAGDAAHIREELRLDAVRNIKLVDEAFISYKPIQEVIYDLHPDIVVKGKEHELLENAELESLQAYGGRLIFSSGESNFSSLDLLRREFDEPSSSNIEIPQEFLQRNKLTLDRIRETIRGFPDLTVGIIGDLIVDEYITCQPLGMSQEDPTLVVAPMDTRRFIGGAGIVAAHASGLGASTHFFSLAGDDEVADFARGELERCGVNHNFVVDQNRPTTLKKRYRADGKSLLRVSHLHAADLSMPLQRHLLSMIESKLSSLDLLVFSDFNYGALPQFLVDSITQLCLGRDMLVVADSQSSSQLGDIGRFKSMDLLTPTEREARLSLKNRDDGLVVLAGKLKKSANAKNIILKLGGEGLLIQGGVSACGDPGESTDRIKALNSSPIDVSGAGDSLLISTAMSMARGGNICESSLVGALAAALQVGKVGNVPMSSRDLLRLIE